MKIKNLIRSKSSHKRNDSLPADTWREKIIDSFKTVWINRFSKKSKAITKEKAHKNRLKAMFLANVLISAPIGLMNMIAPDTFRKIMKIPSSDPIQYQIASGAIPLAFGLAGLAGLRAPIKLSPVLALQTVYKSLFLFGAVLPLALKKKIPVHAAPMIGTYLFFLVGNLMANPFSSLLPSKKAAVK